jgi:6-phosphogluconate dehydrogenase
MTGTGDLGVVGLAVMGANLARNAARKGFTVGLYNRHFERTDSLIKDHGAEGKFLPAKTLQEFIGSLAKPRVVVIMVKAGKPVDDMIEEIAPLLEKGDILVDAGNSLFSDTERRSKSAQGRGLRFVGMGVSGGEEGALLGPSMMPGGDREAWDRIAPIFTKMAAKADNDPCCAYMGPGGAGHFVKMVHNGIEYADMQLIAEAYDLFKTVHGLNAAAIAEIFTSWKSGPLDSYLIDITATVLRKQDAAGGALVDQILDEAEQKGTGRWTAQNALELGAPLTAITEAVFARSLSGRRTLRLEAAKRYAKPAADIAAVHDALLASKIVAYAQGLEQMSLASKEFNWALNLGEIASIWRAGCIIRAKLLGRITAAYAADPGLANLLLAESFHNDVVGAVGAWRKVVADAVMAGVPMPAFSSSLAYFDGLTRARGPANLLQGLRDFFGAHTYRRLDKPGSFHTRWSQDGAEVSTDGGGH